MNNKPLFDEKTVETILKILRKGDSVELKKENGNLVVVEIRRQKKMKQTFTIG